MLNAVLLVLVVPKHCVLCLILAQTIRTQLAAATAAAAAGVTAVPVSNPSIAVAPASLRRLRQC
jgi:hypothetical protein